MVSNGNLQATPEHWAKHKLPFIVRMLAGILLLYIIFQLKANFGETMRLLRSASPLPLVIGLFVVAFGEVLTAWKWKLLLKASGVTASFRMILKATFIGIFYNHLLPGSIGGDVAKTAIVAPLAGGFGRAYASIFMQRNTGLAGLLIIANIAVWYAPIRLSLHPDAGSIVNDLRAWIVLLSILYILANIVLISSFLSGVLRRIAQTLEHDASGRVRRYFNRAVLLVQRMHGSMLLMRRAVPLAVALSIISQLLDCYMMYLAAQALGLNIRFIAFCIFVPVVNVASMIPVSINGIGVREAVYIALLAAVGASAESAVAVSLLHLFYLLCLGAVGAVIQLTGFRSPTGADVKH